MIFFRCPIHLSCRNEYLGGEYKRVEGHACLDGERLLSYLKNGNNVYGYVPCLSAFLRRPNQPHSLNFSNMFSC